MATIKKGINNVLYINSSGNVGVGVIDPLAKLHISGSSAPAIRLQSSSGPYSTIDSNTIGSIEISADTGNTGASSVINFKIDGSDKMRILSSGNVGIGTTSPSQKLHVEGGSETIALITTPANSGLSRLTVGIDRGLQGGVAIIADKDNGEAIIATSNSSWWPMIFKVRGSDGTNERMRITNTGNVGVGTTAPVSILHVSAPKPTYTDSAVVFRGGTTNNNSHTGITLTSAGDALTGGVGSNYLVDGTSVSQSNSNRSTGYLRFANTTVAGKTSTIDIGGFVKGTTTDVSRLFIDVDGNVGIGNSSPLRKLHVVGNFAVNAGTGQYYGVNITGGEGTNPTISIGDWHNASANLIWDSTNRLLRIDAQYSTSGAPIVFSGNDAAIEYARFTATGNFGIGTTSPLYKLQISDTAANGRAIQAVQTATSGTNYGGVIAAEGTGATQNVGLYVNAIGATTNYAAIFANGNVGIGTTAPGALLDVAGNIKTSTQLRIEKAPSNSVSGGPNIYFIGGTGASYSQIQQGIDKLDFWGFDSASWCINMSIDNLNRRVGIGTTSPAFKLQVGTPAVVAGSDYAWSFDLTRANDTARGFSIGQGAGGGTVVLGSHNADIAFGHTFGVDANGNPAFYETMRIQHVDQAVGNVGIGTTNPLAILDIYQSGQPQLRVRGTTGANHLYQDSTTGTTTSDGLFVGIGGDQTGYIWHYEANPLIFATGNAERIRITSGGNVGIGTTNPSDKLHVYGGRIVIDNTLAGQSAIQFNQAGTEMAVLYRPGNVTNQIRMYTSSGGDVMTWNQGNVGIGNTAPSQKLHVTGNIRVTGAYYDSNNETGSSGQILTSTGSGTDWVAPASLYDLLPAARVAYNWTGQVVNDTWTDVFTASNNVLTTGTWMVQMYISDNAVGGGHYAYTYTGTMQWYQDSVNQDGEAAASEIYLHRMGHAANSSVLYLRTTETRVAGGNIGKFQIKGNYSNTANTTIQFKFVKIF